LFKKAIHEMAALNRPRQRPKRSHRRQIAKLKQMCDDGDLEELKATVIVERE
jgi:hypothetical protein